MAARKHQSYPNAGRMGSLSYNLALQLELKAAAVKRSVWVTQPRKWSIGFGSRKGVIISCVREVLIAVYRLPGHGHSQVV